jgi:hypothetical protein
MLSLTIRPSIALPGLCERFTMLCSSGQQAAVIRLLTK